MKHYTNGLAVIEVIRSTDKTVFYRAADLPNEPESRMLKTTFERDFHEVDNDGPGEEDGPWAEGWEERAGITKTPEKYDVLTPSQVVVIHAATPEEAISMAAMKLGDNPRNKRAPMGLRALTKIAALNVKREKQFRKDLRYGSRKAKVVAKRALLHAKV